MSETPADLYCANHPNVPTQLRCNRCSKPICVKCAVSTPTGYRCRECVRGQQKVFETTLWYDHVIAFAISAILSLIGSRIIPLLGFFTIFLAPIAGVIIAEAVRTAVRKRRSRLLYQITALGTALGALPFILLQLVVTVSLFSRGGGGFGLSIIWQVVYVFIVTSTVYYRISGIRM